MKPLKYKLIKTYPGSPKLGSIFTKVNSGMPLYEGGRLTDTLNEILPSIVIENQPEHWEKVINEDYEILSIRCTIKGFNNYILNRTSSGKFANEHKHIELDLKFYEIYSIKRLSDGGIFTIGDIIERTFCKGSIMSFLPNSRNTLDIVFDNGMQNHIDTIKPPKKPLFTTEDGVEIFEGDAVYSVHVKDGSYGIFHNKANLHTDSGKKVKGFIDFSSRKNAEEYVIINKPCISLMEVLKIKDKISNDMLRTTFKEALIQLVKSKL